MGIFVFWAIIAMIVKATFAGWAHDVDSYRPDR